jgi:hypothetical protein
MAGNLRIPLWTCPDDGETLALGIRALREWAEGKPPRDPATRPEIVRRIQAIVHPALRAAVWPRWLFLERAFLDASATGDLLFAALVLRTMCEEVQRLHALDLSADQLASLAGSSVAADHERPKLFLLVAWTSLADLPQDMVLDSKDWPTLKLMATAMPRLERARATLNSYVHPNYGSHITALFPERASAARLLLEAVVALYEAFFALSWAEQPVAGRSIPTGIGTLESWPRSVRRLQSHTLPEVRRTAANPALAEVMKAPALIEWLTAKRDDLVDMLRDPAIAPLVNELPRRSTGGAAGNEVSKYRMWEGARAIDVLHLASARRVEQLLAGEFSSGAPDPSDQIPWLRFNASSLQLAILIDQVKAAAFKTQLVRQVAQGNSVGALLCVRSLIEHRALAVWVPQKLGISLDALAGDLRAATPLPEIAADVEQPLANFLAAQAKGSKEEHRSWVTVEHGGVRTAWLNLSKIVETAFPVDDRFRTLYALASAAMHGRYGRGRDLMLNSAEVATQARLVGLLVLERLCNRDEEMDHFSAALAQSMRLEHAAAFGGTSAATTDVMAQQAFGLVGGTLLHGIDYSGEGTAESPFCISTHLQFHKTSYALLEQLGVDVTTCPRVLDHDTAGRLCDRWRPPARDYWFQAPITKSSITRRENRRNPMLASRVGTRAK